MILEISNVTVGYFEDIDILSNLSLRVDNCSTTSIIGPNGAGKSTLLKTIFGFLHPRKGEIAYNGESIVGMPPHALIRKGISYLPQEHSTFPQLTVEENLMMGLWAFRDDKKNVKERLEQAYSQFPSLGAKRHVRATFLSGGELKMLEFAKVLLVKPRLLLIDEPSAGLAPTIASQVYSRIGELKQSGTSVLLVDQNIRQAVNLADFVYMIEMGKNRLEGPREDFKKRLEDIIHESLLDGIAD